MPNSPVLLAQNHAAQENPWGKSVVGWKPNSQGVGGIHNPMGFGMTRVVHRNEEGDPLYDQVLLIENAGAVTLPISDDGRIGLIRTWRLTSERLMDVGADYIRKLESEGKWGEVVEQLGQWHWECPRGLAPANEGDESLQDYIIRTAKLEAAEEAGFQITDARIRGQVNVNTTFFAHSQYVVSGRVVAVGEKTPEDLEVIGEVRFFTIEELRNLNATGEFVCGLTLSAMAICGHALF